MSNRKVVTKVREFNRFYMPKMKLLGNNYLGSEYSAAEARVFFEIYENEGYNAAHIAKVMNIDKSYLSKIIAGYEKEGYIERISSPKDRRSYNLYLTQKGKNKAEELIRKSEEEIEMIIKGLSNEDRLSIEKALDTVMELLRKGECNNENSTV